MPRKSGFQGSGKNDVWFAIFCIAAVIVVSLLASADKSNAPKWPGPVPAAQIKE